MYEINISTETNITLKKIDLKLFRFALFFVQ